MALKGLNQVMSNLNKELKKIEGATAEGLEAAGMFIQARSVEIAPSDFGALRNSVFTGMSVDDSSITVRIGYTAEYAGWVHEMPMTLKGKPRAHFGRTGNHSNIGPTKMVAFGGGSGRGTYWDSGGENKFLQKPLTEEQPKILGIIQKRAKI